MAVILHQRYPRRFRNYEDAMLFMACCCNLNIGHPFPSEKIVWPRIRDDGKEIDNPEYLNAPYELAITTLHP